MLHATLSSLTLHAVTSPNCPSICDCIARRVRHGGCDGQFGCEHCSPVHILHLDTATQEHTTWQCSRSGHVRNAIASAADAAEKSWSLPHAVHLLWRAVASAKQLCLTFRSRRCARRSVWIFLTTNSISAAQQAAVTPLLSHTGAAVSQRLPTRPTGAEPAQSANEAPQQSGGFIGRIRVTRMMANAGNPVQRFQ